LLALDDVNVFVIGDCDVTMTHKFAYDGNIDAISDQFGAK